jgi:transcriptional regulator with XRE-family HTH domain
MMKDVVRSWRQNRRSSGRRLRAFRERAELSQLALAEVSGITNDTICRIELGRRAPQAATIQRLAKALSVVPEQFVSDEPDVPTLEERLQATAARSAGGSD